jgi:hypothetical protein
VICDAQAGSIVGYVSLWTAQVERVGLTKAQQRKRPDPLPAILLGPLAVDLRWQGQGIARSPMFYALTTAVRLSVQVGCFCVLTHPLDDDVRALCTSFGFEDLPFDPAVGGGVDPPLFGGEDECAMAICSQSPSGQAVAAAVSARKPAACAGDIGAQPW